MTLLEGLKKQLTSVIKGEEEPRRRSPHRPSTLTTPLPSKQGLPQQKKKNSLPSPSTPGFERIQKSIYTDGFESIYALENVDLSTVRPMMQARTESIADGVKELSSPSSEGPLLQSEEVEEDQLEMELGAAYCEWMPSLRLSEPIQVLELSQPAYKALIEGGKTLIRDLTEASPQDLIQLKGLGQGHLDEISSKCQSYLGAQALKRSRSIDFAALLRATLGTEDRKACSLCLEPFELSALFPLAPADEVELRHLSSERRQERREAAQVELTSERKRRLLQGLLEDIAVAFIHPWMRRRMGIATEHEILERLERLSTQPSMTKKILSFIRDTYFQEQFPLRDSLMEGAPGVYCVDSYTHQLYSQLIKRAHSYFGSLQHEYALDDLSIYLEREFSRLWQGFPEGFVAKVLRMTPSFSVYKGKNHRLYIRPRLWDY